MTEQPTQFEKDLARLKEGNKTLENSLLGKIGDGKIAKGHEHGLSTHSITTVGNTLNLAEVMQDLGKHSNAKNYLEIAKKQLYVGKAIVTSASSKFNPTTHDVKRLVEEISIGPNAHKNSYLLSMAEESPLSEIIVRDQTKGGKISADANSLHRLVSVLVSDARKAKESGRNHRVQVTFSTGEKGFTISVAHNGKTMTDKEKRDYFKGKDEFGMSPQTVQEIISKHGGSHGIKSRRGGGTTIHVRLPKHK